MSAKRDGCKGYFVCPQDDCRAPDEGSRLVKRSEWRGLATHKAEVKEGDFNKVGDKVSSCGATRNALR